MITRIRIPATFFLNGARRDEVAEFKLGAGPCGKTVTELEADERESPGYFSVYQTTSDGERKVFLYRREDLIGRIEITCAEPVSLDENAGVPAYAD